MTNDNDLGPVRICAGPGCLETVTGRTRRARFHDANCRLRYFRARQWTVEADPLWDEYQQTVEAMIEALPEMPNDILVQVHDYIRKQADQYNAVRTARQ